MYKNTEDHRRQKKRQNKDGRIEFSLRKNNNTKKTEKKETVEENAEVKKTAATFCFVCFVLLFFYDTHRIGKELRTRTKYGGILSLHIP